VARRLIINADDYGLTRGVSRGIREAHLRGIVSSTTAMMNMPGVKEDLHLALDETPRLGMGVHLVLTAGQPVRTPEQVPGLFAADGRFMPLDHLTGNRKHLPLDQVRAEWRAQIERFVAVTGKAPDHLDSHHHTSFFSEGLFRLMLELAQEYGCAVRCPRQMLDGGGLPAEVEAELAVFAPPLLTEFAARTTDFFISTFYDEGATLPHLLSILESLPEGATEVMCHPALADNDLAAISGYVYPRERELAVLSDPALVPAFAERGIQLGNFGEIG